MRTAETEYTLYDVGTALGDAFREEIASPSFRKFPRHEVNFGAQKASIVANKAILPVRCGASITVSTKGKSQIVVTRLRSDDAIASIVESAAPAEAFIVFLHLREVEYHQWWMRDEPKSVSRYERGGVGVVDLSAGPVSLQSSPFDCLQFCIPRSALDEIADENGATRIRTLNCPQGAIDATIHQLGLSILEAMQAPEGESRLFLQHAVLALNARFASIYGDLRIDHARIRGGLAPWQVRRAKALLMAHLEGGGCLTQIARDCDLSASHFARAFKQTIGQAPYQWLGEQRIKFARKLLLHSETPMTEIAMKCGFADQACFTRAFKRAAGTAPGEWRRANRNPVHSV
jgi:AraC family transcriptional regulator